MALPYLPGNNFNKNLGKTKYHKSHHFDHLNDVSLMVGHRKPGIGGEPLLGQDLRPRNTVFPSGEGSNLPAWVAFDRQVLNFDAFFQEAVHEKREEPYRIRNCKIYFYLEDDSIQVIEPRVKNMGVPQGTIIRRHRIPKPPPNDDVFYTVEDFNIGVELNLYSKVFKITGCDPFTANFLRKLGNSVNLPEMTPNDPYSHYRKVMDGSMQPLRPYEKHDTLKQFLDHDRHVLRFFCYWDDTDSMFGDPRELIMHYFLADDTIELREVIPPNSGRDAVPVFVKRGKLPKDVEALKQPGEVTSRTVLNVFGPTGRGGRYILDSLKTGAVHTQFYSDSDLTIGSVVNVWGRKVLIADCDDFTKEFYKTKYGITEFSRVPYRKDEGIRLQREYPPYNGFGSEEDSLCSCMGLLPKPPRRDFVKFMERDRQGLDSNVLRFLARLDTEKPIDQTRRFIISYFMCDDSILVYEPPVRNSGIIGGKFLERDRVKKPNQPRFGIQVSEYYSANDFSIGTTVTFNEHKFVLIDADEYAFRFMEDHSDEFKAANIQLIAQTLKQKTGENIEDLRAFFARNDTNGTGIVTYEQFRSLMLQLNDKLTEHEIMTLARYYSDQKCDDTPDREKLVAIAQEQLRKKNYEGYDKLSETFSFEDINRVGYLDPGIIRTVFHSHHVPLADDLLRGVLAVSAANEQGMINYVDFVNQLNWRDYPVPAKSVAITDDINWQGTPLKSQVTSVNYRAMLSHLFESKS